MTSTRQDREAFQLIVKQAMSNFQHELDLQVKNMGAYRKTFGNLCEAALERLEEYADSKPTNVQKRVKDLLNPAVKTALVSFKQFLQAEKVSDDQFTSAYRTQLSNIQPSLFALFAYFGTAQNYKYTKAGKVLPRCAGTYTPVVPKEGHFSVETSDDALCKNFFDPKRAADSFMFDHSRDAEWFKTEQFKWDDASSPMVCPSCVKARLEHRVEKQKQTVDRLMKMQNTDVKGGLERLKKLIEIHERVLADIPKYEAMMKTILYDESRVEEEEEQEQEEEDVDMAEAGGHAEASEEKKEEEEEDVENVVVRKNEESEDNASQETNGDKMEEDKVDYDEDKLPKTPVLPKEVEEPVVSPKPTPKTTPKKATTPAHREKKSEPEAAASPKKPPVKTKLFDETAKKLDTMEVDKEEDDFETPKRKENQKSESTEKSKKKMETKAIQEEPVKKSNTTPKKSKAVAKEEAKEEEKPKATKGKKTDTEQKPKQTKAKKDKEIVPVVVDEEEELPKPTVGKKSKAGAATGVAASKKRKREDDDETAHTGDHESGTEEKRPTKKAKTTKTTKKDTDTNGTEETPKPTKTTKGKKAEETEEHEKPKKAKATKKQTDAVQTNNKLHTTDMTDAFASIATLITQNHNNPNIIQEMKDAYRALSPIARVIISSVVQSPDV